MHGDTEPSLMLLEVIRKTTRTEAHFLENAFAFQKSFRKKTECSKGRKSSTARTRGDERQIQSLKASQITSRRCLLLQIPPRTSIAAIAFGKGKKPAG